MPPPYVVEHIFKIIRLNVLFSSIMAERFFDERILWPKGAGPRNGANIRKINNEQ